MENLVLYPEYQQMVARLDSPENVMQLAAIPDTRVSGKFVQMPWSIGACRLLYNMGVKSALEAAPICFDRLPLVEGKYKPMKHQMDIAAFMTLYPRSYDLASPRLGKTSATLLGIDYLQRIHAIIGGCLIITTLTTIHGVWKASIESMLPGARILVAHGKDRTSALEKPADFYITNYDSVRISRDAFIKACNEGRIGAVVVDELTHVGNTGSKRHKAIYDICNRTPIKYVYGLTGSPADNPEMVYGMCRVINPAQLPCTTKQGWLNLTTYQWGPEPYQRSLASGAKGIIYKAMQPAIRFNKDDILDLPPVTTQVRECALSKAQSVMRKDLRDEAIALLDSGEVITAANGGVLLNKLMQVAIGAVKTHNDNVIFLDHEERTQTILDIIKETDRKVVIFCGFINGIQLTVDEIRQAGYSCEKVDGSVTGMKRADILNRFQNTPDPHVLVCHPTTTAMGVELSAADTMIFNGVPLTGGFVYAQSVERLSSNKQTSKNINIVHVISTPEERKALTAIQKGYDVGKNIAEMFKEFFINNS